MQPDPGVTFTDAAADRSGRATAWRRRALLATLVLVAAAGAITLRDVLTFDALRDHRTALLALRDANYPLAALGFMGLYMGIVAFSLPGATVATLAGGFLFGIFPGVIFNVTGATLGAIAIFLAVRTGLGERLARRMDASDGVVRRIKAGIDDNQWSMLFLIRLLPVVPFFVANLIPALMAVPLHRFAVTTFVGILPGALVFTAVGAGLGDVFARGETPDLSVLFSAPVLLPILGLCALAALPIVVKALRGRKGPA